MDRPIRIVLVEDNDVFREALVLLFGMRDEVEIVAAIGDGEAAVQAARDHRPDVVLMDYRLPGIDGVQATRAVLEAELGVAVVGLTGEADPRETQALLDAGAVACVTKDQELGTIVRIVVEAAV